MTEVRLKKHPSPGKCHVFGCAKPKSIRHNKCAMHRKREWRERHPIKNAWYEMRNKCRRKKRHLGLTFEQFEEFCRATGYTDGSGRQRHNLHIDRIDPRKGYTVDNIQVLTCTDNTAKGNRERYLCKQQTEEPGKCPF